MSQLKSQLLRALDRGERLFVCKMPYPNQKGYSYTTVGAYTLEDANIKISKTGLEYVREMFREEVEKGYKDD